MNRNIRASYLNVCSPSNEAGIIVRDLDIIDNEFILQIDAVGLVGEDLRGKDQYDQENIQYCVRLEQLASAILTPVSYEFTLSSCPLTRLDNVPAWLAHVPVEALRANNHMTAVTRLLHMVFSHFIGAGVTSPAMTLLDTGWVEANGNHTFDANHGADQDTVRIQFEVKNRLVRYKRTTMIHQVSPTKRISEVVPFGEVWPHHRENVKTAIERLVAELSRLAALEPGHYYMAPAKDLNRCIPITEEFKSALAGIHWDNKLLTLVRILQQHGVRCEMIEVGPYEALHCANAMIYFSDLESDVADIELDSRPMARSEPRASMFGSASMSDLVSFYEYLMKLTIPSVGGWSTVYSVNPKGEPAATTPPQLDASGKALWEALHWESTIDKLADALNMLRVYRHDRIFKTQMGSHAALNFNGVTIVFFGFEG